LKDKLAGFFDLTKNDLNEKIKHQKEVLIITAHPDDEVMFFTPTITYLKKQDCNIRILCLSNGNYDGLGKVRENEMKELCNSLDISYYIINNDKLKDDIHKKWDGQLVADIISEHVKDAGTIITFDENGITKHPNHISCYEGLM
jgi:N-acetylglucosaminylphosphatidylinositol deacetylase